MDMINMAPIFYQGCIADRIQTIRLRMAAEFGCEPEEMALTRGASESLQIAQNGIDLKAGDEVITTEEGLSPHADDVGLAHGAKTSK